MLVPSLPVVSVAGAEHDVAGAGERADGLIVTVEVERGTAR